MNLRTFVRLTIIICVLEIMSPDMARGADTSSILASTWNDPVVILREANSKEFAAQGIVNPIEKLQLRFTQNQYADDRKAGLRVLPRGLSEYRLLRELRSQGARLEDLSARQAISKALKTRYVALIEAKFTQDRCAVLRSFVQNASKRFQMLTTASRSSSADAADLLKAREEQQSGEAKLAGCLVELHNAQLNIRMLDRRLGDGGIEFYDWPTAEDLAATVKKFSPLSIGPRESTTTKIAREKSSRAKDALSYDLAKEQRLIEFIEVNVAQDGKEQRYGLELSFNIPGFASSDYRLRERARDLVEYEIEAREAIGTDEANTLNAGYMLQKGVELYSLAVKNLESGTDAKLTALARKSDPLFALAIESDQLGRQMRALDAGVGAFKAYIDFLSLSGKLSEQPRVNFLTRSQKEVR